MKIKILLGEIRTRRGMSLEVLSKKSGVSRSHINFIENRMRNPTISVMCKLAKALGVGLDDIVKF